MRDFKRGDIVILTQAISSPSPEIPLWGSEYGCIGTVIRPGKTFARVLWDNEHESSFFVYKLELYKDDISEDDPNAAFLRKKRNDRSKFDGPIIDRYDIDGKYYAL